MTKKITSMYGHLWLDDGTEIDLEGNTLDEVQVDPMMITSYGEHEIGDDANISVNYDDGSNEIVTGLANVHRLFGAKVQDDQPREIVINDIRLPMPKDAVAYKYADPNTDATWLYDLEYAEHLSKIDPSLVAWPEPPDEFTRDQIIGIMSRLKSADAELVVESMHEGIHQGLDGWTEDQRKTIYAYIADCCMYAGMASAVNSPAWSTPEKPIK